MDQALVLTLSLWLASVTYYLVNRFLFNRILTRTLFNAIEWLFVITFTIFILNLVGQI